jgi:hypothetical protein
LLRRLQGYHSLPEMFPNAYAKHPNSDSYRTTTRIFLDVSAVPAALDALKKTVDFEAPEFAVRFPDPGPAEAAYAAFFGDHQAEILAAPEGRPIRQLVPYAQAIALMRWLRDSHISFDPGPLVGLSEPPTYTPNSVPVQDPPALDRIAAHAPIVMFGNFGPVRVVDARGRQTTLRYKRGLLESVQRFDGTLMRVLRDDVGRPLAAVFNHGVAIGFYVDRVHGLVIAHDVLLSNSNSEVGIQFTSRTRFTPISNPEKEIARLAIKFAGGEAV